MTGESPDQASLWASTLHVPEHVVHRAFPGETVVLNLETGVYHGLNATAGAMLAELERSGTVAEAIGPLTARLGADADVVRRDLERLCRDLLSRGLVVLAAKGS